jgi:hypothetical protein
MAQKALPKSRSTFAKKWNTDDLCLRSFAGATNFFINQSLAQLANSKTKMGQAEYGAIRASLGVI